MEHLNILESPASHLTHNGFEGPISEIGSARPHKHLRLSKDNLDHLTSQTEPITSRKRLPGIEQTTNDRA
jgi:hypothetical protein